MNSIKLQNTKLAYKNGAFYQQNTNQLKKKLIKNDICNSIKRINRENNQNNLYTENIVQNICLKHKNGTNACSEIGISIEFFSFTAV